ncbi:hypothetical protein MexAM1_META1p1967 [Methylorubrum extorquens AM1]|uniref:Uncharacterized protein n=1 Tax=Methylorubrum extorquens (strain ATCC 14718 / DSM 1338 / JCM 2805 / NCIMB 9133 / AM1) TaxID=272630 RepID=C5B2C2_METEA|nr:hypothetical protein MexAM1_META1p1967 [Methylorubrum extorquens AM1]
MIEPGSGQDRRALRACAKQECLELTLNQFEITSYLAVTAAPARDSSRTECEKPPVGR